MVRRTGGEGEGHAQLRMGTRFGARHCSEHPPPPKHLSKCRNMGEVTVPSECVARLVRVYRPNRLSRVGSPWSGR